MAFPTIMGTVVRFMASHAKAHIQRLYFSRHHHILHFTVAKGTDFIRLLDLHSRITEDKSLQMLLMGKVHEIRHVVHLLPGRRYALFPILGELLDTGFVGCNNRVTTHALA